MLAARITLPHFSVSVGDKFSKVGGRHRHRRAAQIGKSCLDLGIGEGGIDFAVELIDDFSRRFLGCADTVPGGRLISRHKLSEGRNVWQRFRVTVVTASARRLPVLMCSIEEGTETNATCTCP